MLQLGFQFVDHLLGGRGAKEEAAPAGTALAWRHGIVVRIVRRPRARRYLLLLERSEGWLLERQRRWQAHAARRPEVWGDGARFLYRGEETALRVEAQADGRVRLGFADQSWVAPAQADYREAVAARLRSLADAELPPRTLELARAHGIAVARVTVRGQRTRWGSCSARGTISLNWRLVQAPVLVRDYLIVHELMHRREMNHSARYWRLVAAAFPAYREAEAWLKGTRLEGL
jgi:predicted metal-dependent hydrolase